MSRNDGNGWSIEPAGQEPDSRIVAGREIGPENTLKVETRVRTPLGLPENRGSGRVYRARALACILRVPHLCRSVQSASEFAVGTIESSGVVLLEHPGRGVAEPERDQDGVRAGLQRQRRAGVPQLAEPEPLCRK